MFCDNCGKQVPDGSMFCDGCGTKIVQQEAPVIVQPIQMEVPVQVPVQVPVPVQAEQLGSQQVYQQPVYQQQMNQQPMQTQQAPVPVKTKDLTKPIGVFGWIGTILLLMIPIVAQVFTIIWAFSSNTNKNRKTLAIALIILFVIGVVLGIIFGSTGYYIVTELVDDYL